MDAPGEAKALLSQLLNESEKYPWKRQELILHMAAIATAQAAQEQVAATREQTAVLARIADGLAELVRWYANGSFEANGKGRQMSDNEWKNQGYSQEDIPPGI